MALSGLDLSAAELVGLSACETGLGAVTGGEGAVGRSGPSRWPGRATVATLWETPDAATAALMSRFYGNLWGKKLGRLAALREAQRGMLDHGRADKALARVLRKVDEIDTPDDGRLPPYYWRRSCSPATGGEPSGTGCSPTPSAATG